MNHENVKNQIVHKSRLTVQNVSKIYFFTIGKLITFHFIFVYFGLTFKWSASFWWSSLIDASIKLPGVPGIAYFIYKNIELLISLGFFDFVKTIELFITQKIKAQAQNPP